MQAESTDRPAPGNRAPLVAKSAAVRAGAVAAVALVVALMVGPFKAGHVLGTSGAGPGSLVGGCLFWLAVGLLAGVRLSGHRLTLAAPVKHAAAGLTASALRWSLCGAVAALAFAVVGGQSVAAALAVLAVVAVSTGVDISGRTGSWWADPLTPAKLTLLSAGACSGGVAGLILPRGGSAGLATVLFVGVILLARKAKPAATAVVLVALVAATAFAADAGRAHPAGAEPVSHKQVRVAGNQQWTTTKIAVAAGEVLRFQAKGSVTFLAGDQAAKADPDGYPARYSGCGGPGFCGVLIGRVGPKGSPFLIGSETALNAPAAGDLELGVNDYDPSDNKGSFEVTVSVEKAGTPLETASGKQTQAGRLATPAGGTSPGGDTPGTFGPALLAALCAGLGALAGARRVRRLEASGSAEVLEPSA